jgi:hypothetical protein
MTKEERIEKIRLDKLEEIVEQIEDLKQTIREGRDGIKENDIISIDGKNISFDVFVEMVLEKIKEEGIKCII